MMEDDTQPALQPGCVYRTPNLLRALRIGYGTLVKWRRAGLQPLAEHGLRCALYQTEDVCEFLRKYKPPKSR